MSICPAYVLLGNSGPAIPAPITPEPGEKYDLRTKTGQLHKARLLEEAIRLREIGLTFQQIGGALGVSESWAAMNVGLAAPRIARADHRVLADRRQAVKSGKPVEAVTAARLKRQLDQWKSHRHAHFAMRRFSSTASLDAIVRTFDNEDIPVTLGGLVPAGESADPHAQIEREELLALIGDIGLEDIARMDESTLERLQARLREAGYVPRGVTDAERQRLSDPIPHRGVAPPLKRQSMTSRHRSSRQASTLQKGKRSSRKQTKRWSR